MTPNRPYLLRAMHEWISDNNMTPYLLVDASIGGVVVPPQAIKEGKVVLNLALQAVSALQLGNELVSFRARFSGAAHDIRVPMTAILAIYAQENGQGLMFSDEGGGVPPPDVPPGGKEGDEAGSNEASAKPARSGPHLRIVK
ncbi:MAG: ClpXP protease specificity-enhancing factor [Xanthomonadales bacterium]|nr:ClpXP protease specificity-enhancing factor [Xanthomonadales bacterium]